MKSVRCSFFLRDQQFFHAIPRDDFSFFIFNLNEHDKFTDSGKQRGLALHDWSVAWPKDQVFMKLPTNDFNVQPESDNPFPGSPVTLTQHHQTMGL